MRSPTELTTLGMWIVECGDTLKRFERKDEVFAHVRELALSRESGRIDVSEDVGGRSRIARFVFGMHPRILQGHLAIEWSGDIASLIFFDDAGSEYRAKDKEQPIWADETARTAIAHGEKTTHPENECLALERALSAVEDYLKTATRPGWLEYEYVA